MHTGTYGHGSFLINIRPLESLIEFKEWGNNNRTVNTNGVGIDTGPLVFPGGFFCLLCPSAQD